MPHIIRTIRARFLLVPVLLACTTGAFALQQAPPPIDASILRIIYNPAGIASAQAPITDEDRARRVAAEQRNNYGLHRAVIVGETTGGGAHPGGVRRITEHFGIWLPTGRAINPITGTNWEGVGIAPDIAVDSADALRAAHLEALKNIRATATDPQHRHELDRAIAALRK